MPILTRQFIKTGLIYFVFALFVGVLLAVQRLWQLPAYIATLTPIYFHAFMLGWVAQLIFGVIYWMFPKYSKEKPHGHEGLWQATYWLLNIGLVLRVISEPLNTLQNQPLWRWLLALSAILQWLAAVVFVLNTWPRVKER